MIAPGDLQSMLHGGSTKPVPPGEEMPSWLGGAFDLSGKHVDVEPALFPPARDTSHSSERPSSPPDLVWVPLLRHPAWKIKEDLRVVVDAVRARILCRPAELYDMARGVSRELSPPDAESAAEWARRIAEAASHLDD